MIKTCFTCLFLLLLPGLLFSQTTEQIISKADQLVLKLTNQEYFNRLWRHPEPSSDNLTPKNYYILYSLKEAEKFNFYIADEGLLSVAGIFIRLDKNLELSENEDDLIHKAKVQLQAYNRFQSAGLISKGDAEKLADPHFPKNFKNPHYYPYRLIYNSNTDSLLWQFERFKGFRNYTINKVSINAETGVVSKKETERIRRRVWEALFQ